MSLLPKTTTKFAESGYWDSFFQQRGKKAFEWYGEYPELCGILHKYVKARDKILVVGCGNSKLSADLHDVGYKNITNIDVSGVVIKQMKALHEKERPDLVYIEMNALDMEFEPDSFSVVLDKGTLDALMPNDDEKSKTAAVKLFDGVDKVLKIGGRYVCISLLQEHILDTLLEIFVEKGWMVRFCRCFEAEEKAAEEGFEKSMPVFIVICTKFKKNDNFKPVLEMCLNKEQSVIRVESGEEIKLAVQDAQKMSLIYNGLKKMTLGDKEISLNIFAPGNENPKYTLILIEDSTKKTSIIRYGAFIVPQGKETEWTFATPQGRQELIRGMSYDRLALIILNRGHEFSDLQSVQNEMTEIVLDLAPSNYKQPISFLSLGKDVGERKEVARGRSEISGEYVIEDCKSPENHILRRLYFLSNQNVIQSEARMINVKTRKGPKLVIDNNFLSCDHHGIMVMGICSVLADKPQGGSVLLIGLGGGSLCNYLHRTFPSAELTVIDLDPVIPEIAIKHFGLSVSPKVSIHIGDGIAFIKSAVEKGFHYDAVLFDVDSKDSSAGMSCPPAGFVEEDFLKDVRKVLNEDGICILNLVCRNPELREEVVTRVNSVFGSICVLRLFEDLNEVVFCWEKEGVETHKTLVKAAKTLTGLIKKKKMSLLPCVQKIIESNFLCQQNY